METKAGSCELKMLKDIISRFICVLRLAIIALAIIIQLSGCSGRDTGKEEAAAENADKRAIKNFTLVETDGSRKKWEMDAELAKFTEDGSGEMLEINNFTMRFFNDNDGEVQALLKARRGNYDRQTQSFQTVGDVEIETENKKIITKNVVWDPVKQIFITNEEVLITTDEGVLRGRGMEASGDLEKINIKQKIKGEFNSSGK